MCPFSVPSSSRPSSYSPPVGSKGIACKFQWSESFPTGVICWSCDRFAHAPPEHPLHTSTDALGYVLRLETMTSHPPDVSGRLKLWASVPRLPWACEPAGVEPATLDFKIRRSFLTFSKVYWSCTNSPDLVILLRFWSTCLVWTLFCCILLTANLVLFLTFSKVYWSCANSPDLVIFDRSALKHFPCWSTVVVVVGVEFHILIHIHLPVFRTSYCIFRKSQAFPPSCELVDVLPFLLWTPCYRQFGT